MSAAPVSTVIAPSKSSLRLHDGVRLAGPVHRLRRAADVVRARHAQTAPARQPARGARASPTRARPVEAFGEAAGVDLQVVDRAHGGTMQVRAAHRERIEAELRGHLVEQRLERVAHVDRAVAAHRAVRRRVACRRAGRGSATRARGRARAAARRRRGSSRGRSRRRRRRAARPRVDRGDLAARACRPIFSRMSVSGRPRCVRKVSSRDSSSFTVPPAARASSAAMISKLSVSVRWPKPPPTKGLTTRIARLVHARGSGRAPGARSRAPA